MIWSMWRQYKVSVGDGTSTYSKIIWCGIATYMQPGVNRCDYGTENMHSIHPNSFSLFYHTDSYAGESSFICGPSKANIVISLNTCIAYNKLGVNITNKADVIKDYLPMDNLIVGSTATSTCFAIINFCQMVHGLLFCTCS